MTLMNVNNPKKRHYEIQRYMITDCEIIYKAGQVDSNRRHRMVKIETLEENVFLKENDKLKLIDEIKNYQEIELKKFFDFIRKELKTSNILVLANLTKEGIEFIEFDVVSTGDFTKYDYSEDENGIKYITVSN